MAEMEWTAAQFAALAGKIEQRDADMKRRPGATVQRVHRDEMEMVLHALRASALQQKGQRP